MPTQRCPSPCWGPAALLLLLAALPSAGCGANPADLVLRLGTVTLLNQSDQGPTPLTVTEFYFVPSGATDSGPNLLAQDLLPGGVTIIGLYPPGLYNGVAVLGNGGSIPFPDVTVADGQPTNLVLP
jgi:hypothetical protein